MAKVDWITWKTNQNELIDPEKIIENIEELFTEYNHYINSIVYEGINGEITHGGLTTGVFNIMGVSPANEEARNILNNIEEIGELVSGLKNKIKQNVGEQKSIEKQQLIDEIQNKILEEESKMNNALNLRDKLQGATDVVSISEVNDVIEVAADRIKVLKEKLDMVQAL